jgi:hypothetical protein
MFFSTERIAQGLTSEWTAEDRMLAVAALLPGMKDDIYAGKYSAIGRPNITSLQHILFEPAEVLEQADIRKEIAPLVAALAR